MGDLVLELGSCSSLGNTIEIARNLGVTEMNWTWEDEWEGGSEDGLVAQEPESSPYQGRKIDTDRKLGVAGANLMVEEVHHAFVQDTMNSKVTVFPTHHLLSHPTSGHARNTSPVQPGRDTYSAREGKVGYTHSRGSYPVC